MLIAALAMNSAVDELRSLKGSKKISNYCINPFFPNLITIERLVELGYNHRYLAKGNRASKTKRLLISRKYTCKVFYKIFGFLFQHGHFQTQWKNVEV